MVCVGGGIGVAVLHPITRAMKQAGNHVIAIIGARTKDLLILEDEMTRGLRRTACLHRRRLLRPQGLRHRRAARASWPSGEKIDLVVAIGPVPMMKVVCQGHRSRSACKTMVSLNPIMVDGTGMCGGCRVTVGGKTKFACVDGPEFDGHQVDFDELMRRLQAYREDEKASCHEAYVSYAAVTTR